ncbi:MAG: heat shock protein Hsp20, family protein [Candidatus Taylorbacteria bacterium]|nr:heat shock protein Hsp20, family protein [Candidatus Taylorbacteria bacterium]
MSKEKGFFKRLKGALSPEDKEMELFDSDEEVVSSKPSWKDDDDVEGELSVDVYETATNIIIKAIIAGVKKEDLDISLSRDIVSIKGSRVSESNIDDGDYFHKELYWGGFARTILLPQEVDIEKADAFEDKGMLTLKLPKIDKGRQAKIRVKSI